jgi:hypothetical protein
MKFLNQQLPTCFFSLALIGITFVFCGLKPSDALAAIYKCKDDSGKISYSDAPCRPPAPPKQKIERGVTTTKPGAAAAHTASGATSSAAAAVASAAPPATPASPPFNIATNGKITKELLSKITQLSFDEFNQGNMLSICNLVAPDFQFVSIDETTQPPMKLTGGKAEFCAAQKQLGEMAKASQMEISMTPGKLDVSLGWFSPKGTVEHQSVTSMGMRGVVAIRLKCAQKTHYGLYGDRVLATESSSVCKPM